MQLTQEVINDIIKVWKVPSTLIACSIDKFDTLDDRNAFILMSAFSYYLMLVFDLKPTIDTFEFASRKETIDVNMPVFMRLTASLAN